MSTTFIDRLLEMVNTFINGIESALSMITTGVNAFQGHGYPNTLGSIWSVMPASLQLFSVSFLIVGLFVALIGVVLKRA